MKYQDFSFTKKLYLHRAQWRYYFYLSRVRILVSPWLLTWLANYKRASRLGARPVLLKSCRNFISIYKINRTSHGRLGIRILSTSAESTSHARAKLTRERYFQHSKIKFVSPSSQCKILYLSHKQRCYTRISSSEESCNNTREKIQYFSSSVWYSQSAADTSLALRASRSGWWMTAKPSPFTIQGRLSEFFWIMAAKTLKNQYCLQTVTFKPT